MKFISSIQYTLLTACALLLCACSGPSSELAVETGSVPATGDSTAAADVPPEPETAVELRIALTSPATGQLMETPDESVILEGTAESSYEIVSFSWANDRGGRGEVIGDESWKTGGIPLELGNNSITVTARDSSGATTAQTLVVKRESGETGSVTLAWNAPTTNLDGSAMTDLAGYRIQYGRMSQTYDYEIEIEGSGVNSFVVEGLSPGTWYFAANAYDSEGNEGALTGEVSTTIQ